MTFEPSNQESNINTPPLVALSDLGYGVYSIQIKAPNNNTLSKDLIEQLKELISEVQNKPSVKALILTGTPTGFLTGDRRAYNLAIEHKLFQSIVSIPFPVIAAMQGDATGAGFLVGALCDFMICSTNGNYYYTSLQDGIFPTLTEYQLYEERFGKLLATDFLYASESSNGNQLKGKGWACPILSSDQVEAYAQQLAANLATKSEESLSLLKQHLSRSIVRKTEGLTLVDPLVNYSKQNMAQEEITSPAKYIELEHQGNVLVITMCAEGKEYGVKALVADLRNIFNQVNKTSHYKSIVLTSGHGDFIPGTGSEVAVNEVLDLQNLILESSIPVIAVLNSNTNGVAWFVSLFCDACIYNTRANYSAKGIFQNSELSKQAGVIFSKRFGNYSGNEILITAKGFSGLELQKITGVTRASNNDDTLNAALQLGDYWGKYPLETLTRWKKENAIDIREKIKNLPAWSEPKEVDSELLPASPFIISIKSKVISATAHPEGILVVKMEDREAKNMFSGAFIEGMNEVFEHVEKSTTYKAVVLIGYDNYFSSGGTKENLLDIQEGKSKFTDNRIFQIAMTCRIPVIAAMQGHGIGGGWNLGMFADLVLFSEESKYFSPYMNYGFTPGAGATFIYPEKIGYDLTRETLLTAQEYSGKELKERGLVMTFIAREKIYQEAMDIARNITTRSRSSLIALKHQLTQHLWAPLEETYELELSMHEKTFVGHVETLKQIEDNFIQEQSSQNSQVNDTEKTILKELTVSTLNKNIDNLSSVAASIKNLLANELHMQEHDIDDNIQFVDLGLDSITGVTFIRKINEKYKTRIDAIKVYSYPTLSKLSRFVKEEVEKVGTLSNKPEVNLSVTKAAQPNLQANFLTNEIPATFANLTEITASVKRLLAEELHMQEQGIDENTQFVDLGLDSITGVTLVRKINDRFKTKIDAIKVYSYPTLTKLSRFLKEEIEKNLLLSRKTVQTAPVSTGQNFRIQQKVELINEDQSQGQDNLPEVTASIKKLLSAELHMQEHEIDENTQFVDLGLDSITGVTFIRKINEKYKTKIDAIKVYSYPTITKLSRFVKEEAERRGTLSNLPVVDKAATPINISTVEKSIEATKVATRKLVSWRSNKPALRIKAEETRQSNQLQPIAVIGMAGQFPMANNLDEFWQNISQGKNCISEISPKRWDIDNYYQKGEAKPGKTNSKWTGALEEYDLFDPLFFNISPTEAESMDPQQRVFLQACWHTIENAGYNPQKLSGSKCGVFVGCGQGDYRLLSKDLPISAMGFTGSDTSILAGRVSYFLNLQGPSLSIETACSSSLVAIANACDSLTSGNSDLALAGGVYIMTGPEVHIKCAQMGMLSQDGKCHTFDQSANGFVPGEGVGVVMLKRLADAERDQDIILGVIQGWGVNQDGKTNGITAPNSESQTRLEQEVYDKFQIDPEQIQLIEAHGTGTKLGDPIEVDALKQAFSKYTQKREYCALGSVKSNIGHCLTAAGVASFIKVIQSLNHKQLPPTINYSKLNEHISLNDSPFYVNDRLLDWKVGNTEKRRAAISAFGFSGTNAHIVLSEYLSTVRSNSAISVISKNEKVIIPISARNAEQLKQRAIDLLKFIQKDKSLDLTSVAYTLQVGREEMEERLGFVVGSLSELVQKLKAYINNDENIAATYQGKVTGNKVGLKAIIQDESTKEVIVEKYIAQKNLPDLLILWTKGLEFDWNKLYGNRKSQRIVLPVYPFAKERYWIDSVEQTSISTKEILKFVLHPLLHSNTSNFREQSYTSVFTGKELFLKDHQVNGQKVLPGVAYLEMARAAIENALPVKAKSSIMELQNTVWLQPIIVDGDKEVTIALFADEINGSQQETINFEVYTKDGDQEILHCQGEAVFVSKVTPGKLDIDKLQRQAQRGALVSGSIYEVFTRMGFTYGPAHQGISHINIGDKEVVAYLHLPTVAEADQNDYHLHPSLMDSALQSSIGLTADLKEGLNKPILPFALDSLQIISACKNEMVAWVRYSSGSSPDDKIMKIDIDLCDLQGNICVKLKGFKSRVLENDIKSDKYNKIESAFNFQESPNTSKSPFDDSYYKKVIEGILNNEVSIDEAVNLG
ncbi:MAG: polyketide synthase dehydratase domain-containing protein [Sporocytophaga sp.]|uniref:polyketide synthase n=1 Tax=Sporocytophaga sp. TaxID=2231183 RepID=UPI001B252235|nr:polyketide synthase [Sporocytophaga sp.]MBO9699913.1 polyketide synthase dehydratase domain-containing protein [Sporocytophaga sp.]